MRLQLCLARFSLLAIAVGPIAWLSCQRTPDAREAPPATSAAPTPTGDAHGAETHAAGPAAVATPAMPTGEPRNPVQAEMRLLHDATRDWVTAIAQNDLASIPPAISRVHAARLVTEDALTRGAYAPPKGGAAALAAFIAQDEAFHGELVALLQAAKANDLPAATRQLGVVLDGCTSCHMTFRY